MGTHLYVKPHVRPSRWINQFITTFFICWQFPSHWRFKANNHWQGLRSTSSIDQGSAKGLPAPPPDPLTVFKGTKCTWFEQLSKIYFIFMRLHDTAGVIFTISELSRPWKSNCRRVQGQKCYLNKPKVTLRRWEPAHSVAGALTSWEIMRIVRTSTRDPFWILGVLVFIGGSPVHPLSKLPLRHSAPVFACN